MEIPVPPRRPAGDSLWAQVEQFHLQLFKAGAAAEWPRMVLNSSEVTLLIAIALFVCACVWMWVGSEDTRCHFPEAFPS